MSNREVAPASQWREPATGARVVGTVYLVEEDGWYTLSDEGPADAYFVVNNGATEIDPTAHAHDSFVGIVGGWAIVRQNG